MALRDKLKLLVSIRDTPHKISLAFAVGVFIGMSPLLGLHTVLGILAAWIFRFNKLATMVGVFVTNPWTIIPIYTFSTWVGAKCLGLNSFIPDIDWKNITLAGLLNDFSHLLIPFVAGTIIIGLVSSVIGYIIIYHIIKKTNG